MSIFALNYQHILLSINKMTTRCCSFCDEAGHNIRTCNDVRISNGWREILRRSNLHRGFLLNDEDLGDVRRYLLTLPFLLVTGIAVQMGGSRAQDFVEAQINDICMRIYTEAIRFEELPYEEKNAFLHWMDPDRYPTEDGTDDAEDIPPLLDDDGNIYFHHEVTIPSHKIQPLLLCLEYAEELAQYTECPICYSEETTLLDMNVTACQHSFCHSCIVKHLERKNDCPMCRAPVEILQVRHQEHYDNVLEKFGTIRRTIVGGIDNRIHNHIPDDIPYAISRRIRPIPLPSLARYP